MSFANKTVIVTAASSGIGAVTAISFAKKGANLVIVGRNEANLHLLLFKVTDDCAATGKAPLTIDVDITKSEEAKRVINETIERFCQIDVLVNNAVCDNIARSNNVMSFSGKVVIITGASSGIGASAALLFSKEGADVTIVGRNETKLKTVTAQCEELGKKPLVIKADVSLDDDVATIINHTIDKFGKIDVLVNNAGIVGIGTILDGTFLEQYEKVAKTNLRAVIKLTTLAAPHLIKTKGNIVNISSISGQRLRNNVFGPYGLTKAGLNYFTNCVAMELAPHGVRVNAISPGPVYTDIWDSVEADPAIFKTMNLKTALDRISKPDEVGELILYLASDKAVAITGANYDIDNGYYLV